MNLAAALLWHNNRAICAWQVLPVCGLQPSWPAVLVGISTFVLQYAASGSLDFPLLGQHVGPVPSLDVLLCTTGVLQWYVFDRSPQGEFAGHTCHCCRRCTNSRAGSYCWHVAN